MSKLKISSTKFSKLPGTRLNNNLRVLRLTLRNVMLILFYFLNEVETANPQWQRSRLSGFSGRLSLQSIKETFYTSRKTSKLKIRDSVGVRLNPHLPPNKFMTNQNNAAIHISIFPFPEAQGTRLSSGLLLSPLPLSHHLVTGRALQDEHRHFDTEDRKFIVQLCRPSVRNSNKQVGDLGMFRSNEYFPQ